MNQVKLTEEVKTVLIEWGQIQEALEQLKNKRRKCSELLYELATRLPDCDWQDSNWIEAVQEALRIGSGDQSDWESSKNSIGSQNKNAEEVRLAARRRSIRDKMDRWMTKLRKILEEIGNDKQIPSSDSTSASQELGSTSSQVGKKPSDENESDAEDNNVDDEIEEDDEVEEDDDDEVEDETKTIPKAKLVTKGRKKAKIVRVSRVVSVVPDKEKDIVDLTEEERDVQIPLNDFISVYRDADKFKAKEVLHQHGGEICKVLYDDLDNREWMFNVPWKGKTFRVLIMQPELLELTALPEVDEEDELGEPEDLVELAEPQEAAGVVDVVGEIGVVVEQIEHLCVTSGQ